MSDDDLFDNDRFDDIPSEVSHPPRKRGADSLSSGSGPSSIELSSDSSSMSSVNSESDKPVGNTSSVINTRWSISGLSRTLFPKQFYDSVYIGQTFSLHHELDHTKGYFIISDTVHINKGVTVNCSFKDGDKTVPIKVRFGFAEEIRTSKHDRYVLEVKIKDKTATVVKKEHVEPGANGKKVFIEGKKLKADKKKAKVDEPSDEVIIVSGTKKRAPARMAPAPSPSTTKKVATKSTSKPPPPENSRFVLNSVVAPPKRPADGNSALKFRINTNPGQSQPARAPKEVVAAPPASNMPAPASVAPAVAAPLADPVQPSLIEILTLRYSGKVIENLTKKPENIEAAVVRLLNDPEVRKQAQQRLSSDPAFRNEARDALLKDDTFIKQIRDEEVARMRADPKFIAELEAEIAQRSIREAFSGSGAELSLFEIEAINRAMNLDK